MLEELASAIHQLGRLAELVAARLARGDAAPDWLSQLAEQGRRVERQFAAADEPTRAALRELLAETADLVRRAASCGDEWLTVHRPAVDADARIARLRRAYGIVVALAPPSGSRPAWPPLQSTS